MVRCTRILSSRFCSPECNSVYRPSTRTQCIVYLIIFALPIYRHCSSFVWTNSFNISAPSTPNKFSNIFSVQFNRTEFEKNSHVFDTISKNDFWHDIFTLNGISMNCGVLFWFWVEVWFRPNKFSFLTSTPTEVSKCPSRCSMPCVHDGATAVLLGNFLPLLLTIFVWGLSI